ncbi:MAG: hypothetical protein LQ352_005161 [Teloschistes flavicans]|nr:MAG: hypothetical protein LQ352_005161 [Teloschistes flavicans]
MSDNLSTIRQAAATKAKLPAVDAMPSTAGVTQPEAASQANGETPKALENGDADTAKVPAANADVTTAKTSPKKRIAAKAGDDESPTKKARATAKAKSNDEEKSGDEMSKSPVKKGRATKAKAASAEPKVKSEGEDIVTAANDEDAVSDAAPEPKTPKKGGRATKAKTPAEPKTPKNTKAVKEPKSAERKRATPGKVADKVPLPTDWTHASGADKMLVKMKEEDGKSWNDIRDTWFTMTGQETAGITDMPNSKRLQVIMMQLQEGELSPPQFFLPFSLPSSILPQSYAIPKPPLTPEQKEILLAAKHEVETNWKNSKWVSIAVKMEENGAKKYPTEFLQKEFKKIQAEAAATAAASNGTDGDANGATINDAKVLFGAALEATAGDETVDDEAEE